MNNPDSLDTLWRETFTAKDSYTQKKLLLNPQYGGDGRTSARCDQFAPPVAAFPAHRTPVAVAFYTGAQFPARYRDDAFIASMTPGTVTRRPRTATTPRSRPSPAGDRQGRRGLRRRFRRPGVIDSQKGRVWRVLYRGADKEDNGPY